MYAFARKDTEEKLVDMRITGYKHEEKVGIQLVENTAEDRVNMQLEEHLTEEETDHMQLRPNKVKDRSVCDYLRENVILKEPVDVTPQISKIKKKRFRKIRKFFGKFSCIGRTKY